MFTIPDREVRAYAASLPECWKEEYKLDVAHSALQRNRAYDAKLAYDAANGLSNSSSKVALDGRTNPLLQPMQLQESGAVSVGPRHALPRQALRNDNLLRG